MPFPTAVKRRSGWRRGAAMMLALALVLVFTTDLLDADCDPLPAAASESALHADDATPDDACAGMCVPDCFCCSHLLPGAPALPRFVPTWTREAEAPVVTRLNPGSVRPPDHPPCSLT